MGRIQVNLRMERSGEGRVKVVWGDASACYPPYRLVTGWLEEKVAAVRVALEALGDAYRQPRPDYEAAVAALAEHGHALRQALFDDCPPEDRANAEEVRAWFDGLAQGAVTVTVNADASVPIPWGALHEHGASSAPEGDQYDGFWAPRFEVAALYSGMRALPGARAAGRVKLLAGLNQEVFERTRRASYAGIWVTA